MSFLSVIVKNTIPITTIINPYITYNGNKFVLSSSLLYLNDFLNLLNDNEKTRPTPHYDTVMHFIDMVRKNKYDAYAALNLFSRTFY